MFKKEQDDNINEIIKSTENIIDDDDTPTYSRKTMNLDTQSDQIQMTQNTGQFIQEVNSTGGKTTNQSKFTPFYAKSPIFVEGSKSYKNDQIQDKKNVSQGDKLRSLLNDQSIRKSIVDLITQHGIQISVPILKLQVTSNDNYELDQEDILKVFSRFGKVLNVITKQNGKAYIIFADIISALFAQKSLNGHYIPEIDVKLAVSLCNSIDEVDEIKPKYLEELSKNPPPNIISNSNKENFASLNFQSPLPNMPPGIQTPIIPTKYTCKYEIQIDNKEFQVARRIIGPKGSNMKKIIDICQKNFKNSDITSQNDFLKLRLRGRGSGFKEGPEQRESDDPLHLCVSSKYADVYAIACRYVEDLLANIYSEYRMYCLNAGRRFDPNIRIKRTEAFGKVEQSPMNYTPDTQSFELFSKQFDQLLSFDDKPSYIGQQQQPKIEFDCDNIPTITHIPNMHLDEELKEVIDQSTINFLENFKGDMYENSKSWKN